MKASDCCYCNSVNKNEVARAIELREIVTSLGPAYIKLGQALSIRPDILSPSAMVELQKLCDKVKHAVSFFFFFMICSIFVLFLYFICNFLKFCKLHESKSIIICIQLLLIDYAVKTLFIVRACVSFLSFFFLYRYMFCSISLSRDINLRQR